MPPRRPTITLAALLAALAGIAAPPAGAQPRDFACTGAEQLEDDVFEIPFPRGGTTPGEAGRAPLAAAAELARAAPDRNICILGHADDGGGARGNVRLAARRAGAVAEALTKLGIPRDRIRGEARVANFSRRTQETPGRNAAIVVLPAAGAAAPADQ